METAADTVLSFDCGLRNLAAALVARTPAVLPQEFRALAHTEETREDFHARALQWFIRHAWRVQRAELIDVSDYLSKPVKRIKALGLMATAQGLHDALAALQAKWWRGGEPPPTVCAVEVQHNSNAVMRAVSLAIPMYFMRSWPRVACTAYEGVTGAQKLKLCAALGFVVGSGLQHETDKKLEKARLRADKAAAKAAAAAARHSKKSGGVAGGIQPPLLFRGAPAPAFFPEAAAAAKAASPLDVILIEDSDSESGGVSIAPASAPAAAAAATKRRRVASSGGGDIKKPKDKYEDNKLRSVLTMAHLCTSMRAAGTLDASLEALLADHNIADAVLQGVWVLWQRALPRVPARKRKKAVCATDAAAAVVVAAAEH